MLDERTILLGP
jgi:hypothetical protein